MKLTRPALWLVATCASHIAEAGPLRRRADAGDGVEITPLVVTTITSTPPPQTIPAADPHGAPLVLTPAPSVFVTVVPLSVIETPAGSDRSVSTASSALEASSGRQTSSKVETPSVQVSTIKAPSSSPLPGSTIITSSTTHEPSAIITSSAPRSWSWYSASTKRRSSSTIIGLGSSFSAVSSTELAHTSTPTIRFSSQSSVTASPLPDPGHHPVPAAAAVAIVTETLYTTIPAHSSSVSSTRHAINASVALSSIPGVAYVVETQYTTVYPASASSARSSSAAATSAPRQTLHSAASSSGAVGPTARPSGNYTASLKVGRSTERGMATRRSNSTTLAILPIPLA